MRRVRRQTAHADRLRAPNHPVRVVREMLQAHFSMSYAPSSVLSTTL